MTQLPTSQLIGVKMPEPTAVLILPDGTFAQVQIGGDFELLPGENGGLRRLSVRRYASETPKQEGPIAYRLSKKGAGLRVWRNGLRQAENIDYTTDGLTIVFAEIYKSDSAATVVVDYLPA